MKNVLILIIATLLQLLFVYAAVSKLIDFQKFTVELGQSPLVTPFTTAIAIATPLVELLAAALLFFNSSRLIGLYVSFALMILFTAYIVVITTYSAYVPCSCGGILGKMGWSQHLIFNICFTGLSLAGILLMESSAWYKSSIYWKALLYFALRTAIAVFVPILIVGSLLAYENQREGQANGFTRNIQKIRTGPPEVQDMRTSTYYIAGLSNDSIFLANFSTSGEVVRWSYDLQHRGRTFLSLPDSVHFGWGAAHIFANSAKYCLEEGITPRLFAFEHTGKKFSELPLGNISFDLNIPLDKKLVFRTYNQILRRNILASLDTYHQVRMASQILKPQQDGVFSTDGMLLHDDTTGRYMYVYYYRNGIAAFDADFQNVVMGHTIDTVTWAKITLSKINTDHQIKFSAPPERINTHACVNDGRLYIYSPRRADNEKGNEAFHSSVIDVYDISTFKYLHSFYVPNYDKEGIRDFAVNRKEGKLVLLRGNYITVYPIKDL